MDNLDKLWKQLLNESLTIEQHGLLTKYIYSKVGLAVGLDTVDNKKVVLLSILDTSIINESHFPQWEGTHISVRNITPEKIAIVMKLVNEEYLPVYNALISNLFDEIKDSKTNIEALTCFTEVLYRWYEFFKKFGVQVLSEEKQRGLYGELYFIKSYLLKHGEPVTVLNSWQGHDRKNHDFSFRNGNLEVKTTIRKAHKKVHISSEKQLDDTGLPNLYLYCITLNMDSNNGQSLPELVHDLDDYFRVFPNANKIFNEYLINTGYLSEHEPHYFINKYIYKKDYLFRITENFPRITDPPEGVGDLKYSLLIASCLGFQADIDRSIKRLL